MSKATPPLLLALACVIFAAWFFRTYEKVVIELPAAYQGEARFNHFLAAEMLLSELGIDADSRSSLSPDSWLPDYGDTLLVQLSAAFADEDDRNLISAWISFGGHLVLLPPEQETRLTSDFLDYLGFRLVEIESGEDDVAAADNANEYEEESFAYLIDLEATRYRIEMTEGTTADASLTDQHGIIAARLAWSEGYVTLIADSIYFENDFIADSDHARLLLDIVAGFIDPGKVWFIYAAAFPPLWLVIWSSAPYAVMGLAAILACWLWAVIPAFGPRIRPDSATRRSIIEHIRAAGYFVWRHHGATALARSGTSAIIREAESRHPGISRLTMEKQAGLIARMTGHSAQAVLDILGDRREPRQREFTQHMQLLQKLRKEL